MNQLLLVIIISFLLGFLIGVGIMVIFPNLNKKIQDNGKRIKSLFVTPVNITQV